MGGRLFAAVVAAAAAAAAAGGRVGTSDTFTTL